MDVSHLVDIEVAAALSVLPSSSGAMSLDGVLAARARWAAVEAMYSHGEDVEIRDQHLSGAPPTLVRLFRPTVDPQRIRPCLLWVHGGGYVIGTSMMDAPLLERWSRTFDCVIASVEYRLAPEHPYPAGLSDCYLAMQWITEHAADLRIDPSRIGIGGGSAGGGLAACAALLARDNSTLSLSFQLLIYPMLDDRQTTFSSQWDTLVWGPEANKMGWTAYLGPRYGGEVPYHAAASRATDLTGLPPTFLGVGALDGFVDEDLAFAAALIHAQVPTELHVYPGAPHGFTGLAPASAIAQQANLDIDRWLGTRLGQRPVDH